MGMIYVCRILSTDVVAFVLWLFVGGWLGFALLLRFDWWVPKCLVASY